MSATTNKETGLVKPGIHVAVPMRHWHALARGLGWKGDPDNWKRKKTNTDGTVTAMDLFLFRRGGENISGALPSHNPMLYPPYDRSIPAWLHRYSDYHDIPFRQAALEAVGRYYGWKVSGRVSTFADGAGVTDFERFHPYKAIVVYYTRTGRLHLTTDTVPGVTAFVALLDRLEAEGKKR